MIRPLSKRQQKAPPLPAERRQYQSIFGLAGGLDYSKPTTMLGEQFTPSCSEVLFRRNTVGKAKGTQWFAGTNTVPLHAAAVMHINQYYKLNSVEKLMVHTDEHSYAYNTATNILECITRGVVIDDCEDVWTANADVTVAIDTDARKGTYSVKATVDANFTTGVAIYENRASQDITAFTHIHFYIKNDVTTVATTLDLRISEQTAGGTGATYEDLSIPALVAGVWTEISLEIGTPANFNALLSVAIVVAVDIGAMVINIDDVMAVAQKTGDEDDNYTSVVMNDYYLSNNGIAPLEFWDQSAATFAILAGGTNLGAKKIGKLGERVVLFHVIDTGTVFSQRVQWTVAGGISTPPDATDWTDAGSGDTDLESIMGNDEIMTAEKFGNFYIIYGGRTLVLMEYTGKVSAPYSFYTKVTNKGLAAPKAIINLGNEHIFMGWDNVYSYRGGQEVIPMMGEAIRDELFSIINPTYIQRCFISYIEKEDEIRLYFPDTSNTTPNKYFAYNRRNRSWSRGERSYIGFGYYKVISSDTWNTIGDNANTTYDELPHELRWDDTTIEALSPLNLYGDTVGRIQQDNESTNNLVGVAIDGFWESKDFVVDKRYRGTITNWMEFSFETRGNNVDVSYSLDQGQTWSSAVTFALTSAWENYTYDFEANSDLIRFRLRNNTLGETWEGRELEVGFLKASDRGVK